MKINYRQLSILVFMSFVSLKLLALPSLLYVDSGNMSWLVALVLMIVDALYVFLILDLMKKCEEKNILEFMKKCLGPVLSRVFLAIYILKYALVIANISKGLEFFVVENFYNEFNWLVFILPLMALIGYMTYKGIRNIARVSEMINLAIVIGCLYIAFQSVGSADPTAYIPMFKDGVVPLFESGFKHLSWFGSASFMMLLFGKVDFKEEKKWTMIKYLIFAIVLVQIMYYVFYGIFDNISATHNFCISDISQFSSQESSINELSWLIVALWVVAQAVQLALYSYCMMQAIKFTFNIKNNTIPIIVVMVYVLIWSLVGENTIGLERLFFTPFASIITILAQYVIPLVLYIGFYMQNRRKKIFKSKNFIKNRIEIAPNVSVNKFKMLRGEK
ncbi:MAG TPA: spore germination protein [Candidatus Onthoplasma faecipullorum]|nr:spore germination protein [Candidatus Onthoplasma faecipullorum]